MTNISELYDKWIIDNRAEADSETLFDDIKEYLDFQIGEICGKCTPCRDGIPYIKHLITKVENGRITVNELNELRLFVNNLRSSKCSVGLDTGKNMEVVILKHYDYLLSLSKEVD